MRFKEVIVNCSFCGKEKEITKAYSKLYETAYCNKDCQSKHYKEILKGENNPNYSGAGKKTCYFCGKEFISYNKNRKYCSSYCHYNKNKIKLICENCNQEYITVPNKNERFCSKKCHLDYISKNKIRVTKVCETCKKEFEVIPRYQMEAKCCSRECSAIWRKESYKGSKNPRWEGGSNGYRGEDWYEQRRKALERDADTCNFCGELIKVSVHHIIQWRKTKDNHIENLICLCPKCHATEENYFRQFNKPSFKTFEIMKSKYPNWKPRECTYVLTTEEV